MASSYASQFGGRRNDMVLYLKARHSTEEPITAIVLGDR